MMIPMEPISFWQYFDIIVIALVSTTTLYLMAGHKRKTGMLLSSVSQTIAADKRSSLIFSVMMTIVAPLYYAFIWFWVGPHTNAPWYFYVLLVLSLASQMIFVWVPAISGLSGRIHAVAAGFVGIAMLVVPLLLLAVGDLGGVAKAGVVLFLLTAFCIIACLLHPKLRAQSLTLEAVYCVMFWAIISIIAHI